MARLKCQNGMSIQFSIDPMTHLRLQYSKACTEHLTGMELSNSAIVRDALRQYINHLERLLELDPGDPHRNYLGYCLRSSVKGDTRPPDGLLEKLIEQPFSKLSDLLTAHLTDSKDRVWRELNKSWFYVQSFKKEKGNQTK